MGNGQFYLHSASNRFKIISFNQSCYSKHRTEIIEPSYDAKVISDVIKQLIDKKNTHTSNCLLFLGLRVFDLHSIYDTKKIISSNRINNSYCIYLLPPETSASDVSYWLTQLAHWSNHYEFYVTHSVRKLRKPLWNVDAKRSTRGLVPKLHIYCLMINELYSTFVVKLCNF